MTRLSIIDLLTVEKDFDETKSSITTLVKMDLLPQSMYANSGRIMKDILNQIQEAHRQLTGFSRFSIVS